MEEATPQTADGRQIARYWKHYGCVLVTNYRDFLDVYINDRVYWQNVPLDVWTMTIGGYPVVKKWLSYREFRVLGRPLQQEEVTYITEVVRRLKALLLMGESLDANYRAAASSVIEFGKSS